jgi:hypothetical protein
MAVNVALSIAAFLAVAVGAAHSFLGERYILIRLFRKEGLPKLFGGTAFTARTLRFVWHVTTLAWWGFAALLFQLADGTVSAHNLALVIGYTFVASAILTFIISRARHLSWLVFLFIGIVAFCAAPV